jgi:hypothetical protein
MSVDLVGTLPRPVTLAAVVDQARTTLAELLGDPAVPELAVIRDRAYDKGVRTHAGRPLTTGELAVTEIGGGERSHFDIDIPATGDIVWLMVSDDHAVFTPKRTCVGVTVAAGLALAVAKVAKGEYLDQEIWMLTPPVTNPDDVVAHTRLPDATDSFTVQCERYLRQFPNLNGWPPSKNPREWLYAL